MRVLRRSRDAGSYRTESSPIGYAQQLAARWRAIRLPPVPQWLLGPDRITTAELDLKLSPEEVRREFQQQSYEGCGDVDRRNDAPHARREGSWRPCPA